MYKGQNLAKCVLELRVDQSKTTVTAENSNADGNDHLLLDCIFDTMANMNRNYKEWMRNDLVYLIESYLDYYGSDDNKIDVALEKALAKAGDTTIADDGDMCGRIAHGDPDSV